VYGTLSNNFHILHLQKTRRIEIRPFREERLRTAHYPLTVYAVRERQSDKSWKRTHIFDDNPRPFVFAGNQYVVIEPEEDIVVSEGIVAKFVPTSNLIEQGLALTAGRLEFPFGRSGEKLMFGLKNQLDSPVPFERHDYVAYVEFYDLRALQKHQVIQIERDKKIFAARVTPERLARAQDDGVYYDEDDEDRL